MAEAWAGFTLGPAYAANMENHLGRLAPDYLADLIVLDVSQDPFTCAPEDLLTMQSSATMVGGEWVYASATQNGSLS
jgi:predicted amidohydrolase YtcJ